MNGKRFGTVDWTRYARQMPNTAHGAIHKTIKHEQCKAYVILPDGDLRCHKGGSLWRCCWNNNVRDVIRTLATRRNQIFT